MPEGNIPETSQKPRMPRRDDNVILIGKKPTMNYVLSVMTQFSFGRNSVQIKARGKSISQAVNVAEAVRNKFMKELKADVLIGTESLTNKENRRLNVSTISITLSK